MTSLATPHAVPSEPIPLPRGVLHAGLGALVLGIALAVAAALLNPARFYANWLVLALFVLSLGTGALFFVALEFVVNAQWSVPFRRIAEHLAGLIPIGLVALLPALVGVHRLYPWTNPQVVAASEVLQEKTAYLNLPFFFARLTVYAGVWLAFYLLLVRPSFGQDTSHDPAVTRRAYRLSPVFMVAYAVTATFAAIDLVMTLTPEWSSSMFGPYLAVTAIVAGVALTTFAASSLRLRGLFPGGVGPSHFYGLGALLFALNTLAAYLAFIQFMLIWYSNLPHEVSWYGPRQEGAWAGVFVTLVAAHFIVPFLALLSKAAKSDLRRLRWVSAWVLTCHGLELYWIVLPSVQAGPPLWWPEAGFPLAGFGTALVVWWRATRRAPLLPIGDPRLSRALEYRG